MQERRKSKHKFGETKVCKAEDVRKYFINTKNENSVFGLCVKQIGFFVDWISEIQQQLFADAKHLCWRPANLLKRNSSIRDFL